MTDWPKAYAMMLQAAKPAQAPVGQVRLAWMPVLPEFNRIPPIVYRSDRNADGTLPWTQASFGYLYRTRNAKH